MAIPTVPRAVQPLQGSVQPASQLDPVYSDIHVGFSDLTVKGVGCLFIDMLAIVLNGRPMTRGLVQAFMTCLNSHSNYTSAGGANLQSFDVAKCCPAEWGTIKYLYASPRYSGVPTPQTELDKLTAHLATGKPALIEVDWNIATSEFNQHFVLALGMDGVNIQTGDPMNFPAKLSQLCPRYGKDLASAVWRFVLYERSEVVQPPAPAPAPVPTTSIKVTINGQTTLYSLPFSLNVTAIESTPPPEPTYPSPAFTAKPAAVTAGQAVTLSWQIAGIKGVWLDGVAEAGDDAGKPVIRTRTPAVGTAKYTLTVQYGDGTKKDFPATVTVNAAPPPPPVPAAKVQIGLNTLADGGALRDAYSRGCRFFLVMQDWDSACWLADQPGTTVMYRQWTDYPITSAQQQVDALKGATHPKIIYTGPNEGDWGYGWSTTAEIKRHAELDRDVAAIIKARSGARYAGLTAAVGNPDFTNMRICGDFRTYYAPLWNAGLIDIDMHSYSPNMPHIYRTDGDQIYHERRWEYLFTNCGFDIHSPSRIYSGETGMDEGGVGGFPAHNASDQDVLNWCKAFIALSAKPVVLSGVQYPSPYAGGAIFQAGNTAGRWDGYDMRRFFSVLQSGVWAGVKALVPMRDLDPSKQAAINATIDFSKIRTARSA